MTPRRAWRDLAVIVLLRLSMGVQFQTVGALAPALLGGPLAPDHAALGTLIGAYSLPGIVVSLAAGWLTARLGDRRMLAAGMLLMAGGALGLAMAPGFGAALAARLAGGTGGVMLSIVFARMVLDRFQGAALAPAMGIMLSAWPLGIAATLVVLPGFASAELWRGGLLAAGIFAAAGLPLLALLPAAPPRAGADADADADPGRGARLLPGEAAPLVAAGLVWAFYNTAFAIALGFTPALLVERGMAPEAAGWLASLVGWAILPLLPLGGWMVERLGRPVRAALACMAGMAAALLALALDLGPPGLALAAFGLLAAPPASLVMALAGRALSPASRPFGMGIYYTLFFAGMGALPPLAGLARDLSGHAAAPLLAGIGFLGVAMAALTVAGRLAARRGS